MANPITGGRASGEAARLSPLEAARKALSAGWLAAALAVIGGLVYAVQMWAYAHTQESVLDEGAYVYKGLLFATGQYTPYQPYGPWTNHMPLAFLIPGFFQTLFEPGLRTARFAAIGFGLLLLLGMWLVSRRLGGRWWAAAAVWAMALNPALLKGYSTAISQGVVACMLVWTLFFTLGGDRPLWQLLLGSLLAGLMVMTRINMLPVLPLLVFYIAWQYGWRKGAWSALAGGLAVVFWHVLYWPDILQGWTRIPRSLSTFLDSYRMPQAYEQHWDPTITWTARLLSFFHSVRFNFTALVGGLAALALWPKKANWKSSQDFRSAVFLMVLFVSLLLSHMWAALGKDYCVFCFAGYMTFFSEIGLLLVILTAAGWRTRLPAWLQGVIVLAILVLSAGIGYGTFEQTGEALYNLQTPRWMLGDFRSGLVPLGAVLTNKYGIGAQDLRRLLPLAFGLLSGLILLLLVLAYTLWQRRRDRKATSATAPRSFGYAALVAFLVAGSLLAPTTALGGGYGTYDCSGDVLASYEAAGKHLAAEIPAGSLVYWKGTLSAAPLLYVPNIRIFPAQINDGYSMLEVGNDLDLITRFGRWNETLAHQWAGKADFIVIEQRQYKGWLREVVKGGGFIELSATAPVAACREDSYLRIFQKTP